MAEGQQQILENFIEQLKEHFSSYIRDIDIDWQEQLQGLDDFHIKF